MEQRLSLITLGVSDLERAIAFYRGLGWEPHPGSVPGEVVFFQLDGMAFAIWSRAKLAADSAVTDGGGWGGVTLAHNVRSPEEVDATLTDAAAARLCCLALRARSLLAPPCTKFLLLILLF